MKLCAVNVIVINQWKELVNSYYINFIIHKKIVLYKKIFSALNTGYDIFLKY